MPQMSPEHPFFESARGSQQSVALSDGTTVEMPLLTYGAEMFSAFFTISASKARALLPSTDLRPVRPSPRRALLAVQVMEYREKSIEPYREFVVSLLVHRGPDLPVASAALMERMPGAGAYLAHIAVTTEESRRVGWEVLGFPKFLCEVELAETSSERIAEVSEGGSPIFTLAVRKPAGYRERQRSFYSYSLGPDDNRLYHVPYEYTAKAGFRFGPRSARLHLGDHSVSQEIADLRPSASPLLSTHIPQFSLVSNLPDAKLDVGDWRDPRGLYRELRRQRSSSKGEPSTLRALNAN